MKKLVKKPTYKCGECGDKIVLPKDVELDEIVDCPCCSTGYKVVMKDGKRILSTLDLEGEDWGE
jgi:lysine biosynthesis protein LysW